MYCSVTIGHAQMLLLEWKICPYIKDFTFTQTASTTFAFYTRLKVTTKVPSTKYHLISNKKPLQVARLKNQP
ncbi:hypothetical protein AQUCO_03000161v1 [Aquilegia coerulea]|uniref:Uncharacterized protein n=1 Tax=Aquilegia coerulea TaxID=218851 RepID=A0A2G5D1I3_AQUCA|nr:hypothetical protein AQUCO_03000161v1 [Aquilegia coerulea]